MRRARAYSSFCSQVILFYIYPFRRNSFFRSPKSRKKITKTRYFGIQGHSVSSMMTLLRSSSLVLVMYDMQHVCAYLQPFSP